MLVKLTYYFNENHIVAGSTWRDEDLLEKNNMALHVGGNLEKVICNREQLADLLNVELNDFVCSQQTHRAHFYRVTGADCGRGAYSYESAIPDVDALYTYEPNIVLSCFTADCVPVFFYHEDSGVVGVIHSGWKGTVNEITGKVFHQLINVEKNDPTKFHVHLGACLSQQKFEVDEDVEQQFLALGYADKWIVADELKAKFYINNQMVVKKQCEFAGILEENITIDTTCTFLHKEGFSYRRDRQAGRHLHFMMRKRS